MKNKKTEFVPKATGNVRITVTDIPKKTKDIIESHRYCRYDLGCGERKQEGFIGVDFREMPGVDIVQDLSKFPWTNLPDESADAAMTSHLIEHINPAPSNPQLTGLIDLLKSKGIVSDGEVSKFVGEYEYLGGFIRFMDEAWRVLKVGGTFINSLPYAASPGYWQDPTHCLEQGSEVMSRDGFKKISDVKVGEEVLTKDIETGLTEWSRVIRVIDEEYSGDMVRFKHSRMNISVTPNHDMVWGTWVSNNLHKGRADEFPEQGRIGSSVVEDWKGEHLEKIRLVENDCADSTVREALDLDAGDFMELLGWIVSEGSFVERGNYKRVVIFQGSAVNEENYTEIKNLLDRLGLEYCAYERRIDIKSHALYDNLVEIGKQDVRYIPKRFKGLGKTLLLRLLSSAILGDGEEMSNSDGHIYTSISERLADDIQEIAVKCGFRSSKLEREGFQFVSPLNGRTYTRRKQYRVSITRDNPVGYPKPVIEHYDGRIECVTVEKNHTIFVRQNGFTLWTGNCNPMTEVTLAYFDPLAKAPNGMFYHLYDIYRPFPWEIKRCFFNIDGFMEFELKKRPIDKSYGVTSNNGMKK